MRWPWQVQQMPTYTTMDSGNNITVENCTVINTYPIQLRNGELVRDEWLSALEEQGYRVVRIIETKRKPFVIDGE